MRVMKLSFSSLSMKATLKSPRARQVGILYAAMIASIVLGIAVSAINTRFLGPKMFGDFKFLQNIWMVGILLLTFGFFETSGNLLAQKEYVGEERRLLGSMMIIIVALTGIITVFVFGVSYWVGYEIEADLANKLRLYSALLFIFPLQVCLQSALRGLNKIGWLAFLNVMPQLIYLILVIGYHEQFHLFDIDQAVLFYLLSIALTVCFIAFNLRPKFSLIPENIGKIFNANKVIGMPIYWGSLISTGTAQISNFSLAYFFNTISVGEFSLALTITMPLMMIPNTVGTVMYKEFAASDRISRKIALSTVAISVVSLVAYMLLIKPVIFLLYTDKFVHIYPYVLLCAIGSMFYGLADFVNRYLMAQGEGRLLRNAAVYVGVVNVLGYIFGVAFLDVMGAALTKLVAGIVYLLIMVFFYKMVIRNKIY